MSDRDWRVPIVVRDLRPSEFQPAGRMLRAVYEPFCAPQPWGPDYLARVADVASRARYAVCLGAFRADALAGALTLELETSGKGEPRGREDAVVRMLGVAVAWQGTGVARALMAEAQRRASAGGRTTLRLKTMSQMREAQRLYAHLGFRREPDHDVDQPGDPLLAYVKAL